MQDFEDAEPAPTCFTPFAVTSDHPAQYDGLRARRYALACRACAGERFDLIEVHSTDHGGCGVDTVCAGCGHAAAVFHAARDGYDGRLGHLRFLAPVGKRQPMTNDAGTPLTGLLVAGEATYSIDAEELAELASEEAIPVQDLFDWFHVCVRDSATEDWRSVWDYECA